MQRTIQPQYKLSAQEAEQLHSQGKWLRSSEFDWTEHAGPGLETSGTGDLSPESGQH